VNFKRDTIYFIIGIALKLYTTFVLQNLWNWFVVPAFQIPSISFWLMYGVLLLIGLVFPRSDLAQESRWERTFMVLHECIPEDRREAVNEKVKESAQVGLMVLSETFNTLIGNTVILMIGFVVYVLFV
jgi:hypothetical protein